VNNQQWKLAVENTISATLPFYKTFEAPQLEFKKRKKRKRLSLASPLPSLLNHFALIFHHQYFAFISL
jgi:hypothetical protein